MTRQWLQPPRLRVGEGEEGQPRHATWLELFYDLIFVVAVSQLAHKLSDDVSLPGFLSFAVLFIPVWWAWIGTTFYANRFDTDDIVRRVIMGLQMLAIASLAVNVHHGLGESSIGFALAYAASRVMLVCEYLWAGWHIPMARPLTTRYAVGFSIGALLWLISIFVPFPLRLGLWAVGLVIDFVTPLSVGKFMLQVPTHPEHLPERFGLFTIIVLGEAIIAVVNGISDMSWNSFSILAAVLGFTTAFSLWWIYFENVEGSALEKAQTSGRLLTMQVWLYIHLPLVIGLAATGVGVERIISSTGTAALPTPERWLICGSVAMCYLSLAVLHRTGVIFFCKARARHRLWAVGVVLGVAIAGTQLLPITVIALIAAVGIVQVSLDLYQGKPEPSKASV
ncbi:MAG: low temperature requirement protein A [Cyanobacteria bacterium P01_A01_bin.17]